MNYIGKVNPAVINEIKYHYMRKDHIPSHFLSQRRQDFEIIMIEGYNEEDKTSIPLFFCIPPDSELYEKELKRAILIEDFQPVEKWIKLYELEYSKFVSNYPKK